VGRVHQAKSSEVGEIDQSTARTGAGIVNPDTKDAGFAAGFPPDMGDQLARRIITSPTTRCGSYRAMMPSRHVSVLT
jgi:hypothetical protein